MIPHLIRLAHFSWLNNGFLKASCFALIREHNWLLYFNSLPSGQMLLFFLFYLLCATNYYSLHCVPCKPNVDVRVQVESYEWKGDNPLTGGMLWTSLFEMFNTYRLLQFKWLLLVGTTFMFSEAESSSMLAHLKNRTSRFFWFFFTLTELLWNQGIATLSNWLN